MQSTRNFANATKNALWEERKVMYFRFELHNKHNSYSNNVAEGKSLLQLFQVKQ